MKNTKTQRLKFRDVNSGDLQNIISLYGCTETMKYISNGVILNNQQCEEKLAQFLSEKDAIHPLGIWAAESIATSEFVGWFLLKKFPEIEDPGIGYSLTKKFRGQGYATEGSQALVSYAFQKAILNKITAITSPEHAASINVLTKLGFQFQKFMQYHNPLRAKPDDTNLYILTKESSCK